VLFSRPAGWSDFSLSSWSWFSQESFWAGTKKTTCWSRHIRQGTLVVILKVVVELLSTGALEEDTNQINFELGAKIFFDSFLF